MVTGGITKQCSETAQVLFVHTPVEVMMDARSFDGEPLPPTPWPQNDTPSPAVCFDPHGTNVWRSVPFVVWRAPSTAIQVECRWAHISNDFGGLTAKGTLVVTPGTTTWVDPRVQVIAGTFSEFPSGAIDVTPTPSTTRIVAGFEPITVYMVPEDLAGETLPSDGTATGSGAVYDYYAPANPRWFFGRGPLRQHPTSVQLPDGGVIGFDIEWGGLERAGATRVWKNRPTTICANASTGTNVLSTPGELDDLVRSTAIHVRFLPIEVAFRAIDTLGAPSTATFQALYNDSSESPPPFFPTPRPIRPGRTAAGRSFVTCSGASRRPSRSTQPNATPRIRTSCRHQTSRARRPRA